MKKLDKTTRTLVEKVMKLLKILSVGLFVLIVFFLFIALEEHIPFSAVIFYTFLILLVIWLFSVFCLISMSMFLFIKKLILKDFPRLKQKRKTKIILFYIVVPIAVPILLVLIGNGLFQIAEFIIDFLE